LQLKLQAEASFFWQRTSHRGASQCGAQVSAHFGVEHCHVQTGMHLLSTGHGASRKYASARLALFNPAAWNAKARAEVVDILSPRRLSGTFEEGAIAAFFRIRLPSAIRGRTNKRRIDQNIIGNL
jgi:hypothetical protein